MKDILLGTAGFWLILCIVPLFILAFLFAKNIGTYQNDFNSCLKEKEFILSESDCHLCCHKQVNFKSNLRVKSRSIIYQGNDKINIIWNNFHSLSAYLFLLFLSPTSILLFGIIKKDTFYSKIGAASAVVLYAGLLIAIVYSILTVTDS